VNAISFAARQRGLTPGRSSCRLARFERELGNRRMRQAQEIRR
jgi:hypothetical protein